MTANNAVTIERVWAMPSKRTFSIPPIARLIREEFGGAADYLDPFPFDYEVDALEYCARASPRPFGVFDPPYSPRQYKECYNGRGKFDTKISTWSGWRAALAPLVTSKCISFGWNSAGLGLKHGFEITRILLVAHGSMHNDTICTVERRMGRSLDGFTGGGGKVSPQ